MTSRDAELLALPLLADADLAAFAVEVGFAAADAAPSVPADADDETRARVLVGVVRTAAVRAGLDPADVLRVLAFGLRRRREAAA